MCGIVGAIGQFDHAKFKKAVNIIAHRGPDDEGIFVRDRVAMGHRRLSIQDTSDSAHQPMISEDGGFVIVYNGEIYNHKQIRDKIKHSYPFTSTGDTETLLYAYIEYGPKVFSMLNGIFSLAIYDVNKQEFIIARDQLGVKPLYYYLDKEKFLFGSEIKSINLFPIDRSIDCEALYDYVRFRYAPFTKTPFKKIRKLEPGHYLYIDINYFSEFEDKKYYEIPYTGEYQLSDEKQAVDKLDRVLNDSVSRQLLSDVPIGFFLSGGLDSSAVVAMAKKSRPGEHLDCFSIDTSQYGEFEGFSNDLSYARKVAQKFNCNLHVVEANIDILSSFEKMIWNLDEPLAEPAAMHVERISQKATDMGIKVLLSGMAGDELFSGYRRHQALNYEQYFEIVPGFMKKQLAKLGQSISIEKANLRRASKILSNLDMESSARLFNYFTWIPEKTGLSLFQEDIQEEIKEYDQHANFMNILNNIPEENSWLNKMLYWEQKSFLVDHNLNYTDKMSMAQGIETRVPFLDTELVKFATSLDPALKMKGTSTKYLLKKVMEQYLPKEVIYRPKTGFGAPIRKWIKEDMNEMVGDLLSESRIKNRDIFNAAAVSNLIDQNRKGKIDASYTIWSLLAIETWMGLFVDNS